MEMRVEPKPRGMGYSARLFIWVILDSNQLPALCSMPSAISRFSLYPFLHFHSLLPLHNFNWGNEKTGELGCKYLLWI